MTSSRAGLRAASELGEDLRVHVVCVSQAKFHYAVQLATSSRADLRPARKLVAEKDSVMEYGLNRSATRFELSRHVEIARTCLRHVGNQVCDHAGQCDQFASQVASKTA